MSAENLSGVQVQANHREKQMKSRWEEERDVVAYQLARQIEVMTAEYVREVRDLADRLDVRGAYAREEMWREQILDACEKAMKAHHKMLLSLEGQLNAVLNAVPARTFLPPQERR